MIKAIIFDFFGVLCSDEYWKFVKAERYKTGVFRQLADSVNLGTLTWQEFLEKVSKETGNDVSAVQKMYESEKINLPLAAYINQLRKKYKTALLTNASSEFVHSLLEKTKLRNIFDEVIISSEIGLIKPDPRIYEYAVEKLGVKVGEAVFVDDSPARIDGAEAIGMQAVLYENFEQMKTELEKLLE